MATISRKEYNNLFGPTVGDKIRLGNTNLYVEIEKDLRVYVMRWSMAEARLCATEWDSPTNALLMQAASTL